MKEAQYEATGVWWGTSFCVIPWKKTKGERGEWDHKEAVLTLFPNPLLS
jgi:hypothetical protein